MPPPHAEAKPKSVSPNLYLATIFLTAACGLTVEIVAGRMIAPYLGMSLYTWTAVIAVVLAGFSIGHWVGGRMAEWPEDKARIGVVYSLLLAGLSSVLSLVLIRLLSGPIISAGFSPVPTILIMTTALFFLPSFFVGVPSPVLTKLAIEENPHRMGRLLGAFYAASAAGSIIGTLAAGYIFISWLGSILTILTVSATYILLSAILFLAWRLRGKAGWASSGLGIAILAVLLAGTVIGAAGSRSLAFKSVCDVESSYYCIRAVDLSDDFGTPARALVLDHLGHGINLQAKPLSLVSPYVEAQDLLTHLHIGAHQPFRVFFIGGGAYTLPRAWLQARNDARITVAEIDPDVTRFARKTLWLPSDPRLTILHGDARRILQQQTSRFQVIVGDAFHDIAVPNHLVTEEFFRSVKQRLETNGIYLMNVVDNANRPRLVVSVAETIAKSFPTVEIWRSNELGLRTTFVVAGLGKATATPTIHSRLQPEIIWQRLPPSEFQKMSTELKAVVLTDDFAPVDRLIGVE